MVELKTLRISPLSVVSAVLFIVAPFLSWISLSTFGITENSTLVDVARSDVPLNIPQNLPFASLIAMILLVAGGFVILKSLKIGLPTATVGLAIFLYVSYGLFGSPVSVIPVVIAPGIGLLAAIVSAAIGTVSLRIPGQEFQSYVQKIKTREGLTVAGLFMASMALLLDGLNHAGQQELSEFIGRGMLEPIFHLGFITSISLLVVLFSIRKKFVSKLTNTILVGTGFLFIILDAAYHISTGEMSGFFGHDSTELILHVSAYYGAALLLIGRLAK
jgi:hypothetical protein